jgi:hypothetical protein
MESFNVKAVESEEELESEGWRGSIGEGWPGW